MSLIMRGKTLTDGKHIYKVCFPTLNGLMAINEGGEKVFLSYPAYKQMRVL